MRLYDFPQGLYPKRVGIYLAEKGIAGIERIALDPMMPSWPPVELTALNPAGTVPVLVTDDGSVIRSSLAILDFLEELYPEPDMLGATPGARARTRETISVADEATTQFAIWCHKGSPLFRGREAQNQEAGGFAALAYHRKLKLLDTMMGETPGPFVTGARITIADCVTMAILQFAEALYEVPVPSDCPRLTRWYERFLSRPSASPIVFPEPVLALAKGLPQHCPEAA